MQNVRMRAGVDATVDDIRLHQHTVKVMQMYGGTLGKVRVVEAKIAKWLGIKEQSRIGSKAWKAQHEIPKIKGIIQEREKKISKALLGTSNKIKTTMRVIKILQSRSKSDHDIKNL